MSISCHNIHPYFKLNGRQFQENELCELAISLIKDGEAHEKELGELILQWFDDHDYVELMTSGTTGTPKAIHLSKKAMITSAEATGKFFKLKKGDRALLCLPTRYIAGKMMFIRALVLGLELDYVQPNSHPLENVGDKVYDFVPMVPLQVQNSVEKLHHVRTLIIGGAKLNNRIKEKLVQLSTKIYETYGMTETITHIAAKELDDPFFKTLPHAKVSTDERGCLVVHVPSLTSENIVTNDLVELKDTRHFKWLGRVDHVINSGGIKIFPEQIEEKLAHYIPYRFFIIGKDDAALGTKVVLVIESAPYQLTPEACQALLPFEKPKEIIFREKFLETPTGKIKRKETLAVK